MVTFDLTSDENVHWGPREVRVGRYSKLNGHSNFGSNSPDVTPNLSAVFEHEPEQPRCSKQYAPNGGINAFCLPLRVHSPPVSTLLSAQETLRHVLPPRALLPSGVLGFAQWGARGETGGREESEVQVRGHLPPGSPLWAGPSTEVPPKAASTTHHTISLGAGNLSLLKARLGMGYPGPRTITYGCPSPWPRHCKYLFVN